MPAVTVRPATVDDLPGMARVHVETWQATYRGLVPDERLDRLTVANDLESGFGSWVRQPPPGVGAFVAIDPAGEVVGFAFDGPNAGGEAGFPGELKSLYVRPAQQRRGVGTALVGEAARHLFASGRVGMIVWVLEQNPYRRFYERLGGVPVGRRMTPSRIAGIPLPEVSYGWRDVEPLLRRGPP